VATAIEMQQAIYKMNQKRVPEEQFNVRIGINTGYCVAGRIGSYQRMEYTVLGDTVNLASRIESNGKPGHIMIGEATQAMLGPTFEALELEPIRVKNKTNPIRIFEVKFPLS
ncbi:MAG: adenylate/guanylate cyclase domain-containing protein, partial [Planctomycetota bacterium]